MPENQTGSRHAQGIAQTADNTRRVLNKFTTTRMTPSPSAIQGFTTLGTTSPPTLTPPLAVLPPSQDLPLALGPSSFRPTAQLLPSIFVP